MQYRSFLVRLGSSLLAHRLVPRANAPGPGSITGVVRDPSGAVLPGVTVEASSPALIEKVRSVVSDGTGSTASSISVPAPTP